MGRTYRFNVEDMNGNPCCPLGAVLTRGAGVGMNDGLHKDPPFVPLEVTGRGYELKGLA